MTWQRDDKTTEIKLIYKIDLNKHINTISKIASNQWNAWYKLDEETHTQMSAVPSDRFKCHDLDTEGCHQLNTMATKQHSN